jgi:hypothetical protein
MSFIEFPAVPSKGTAVSLQEILRLCDARRLDRLRQRIEADPPPKPFASDGCSVFFDSIAGVSIYPACFFHDLKYWAGYPNLTRQEQVERFIADAELMIDVAGLGVDPFIAETIFRGVRLGGGPIQLPFSWGFGRT